jgi:hypothetical protein
MCECNNKRKKIFFFDHPKKNSWTLADNEVTIFDECINLCGQDEILVDVAIAAELIDNNVPLGVYNVYRLYINGKKVATGGYEAEISQTYAPNFNTNSLIWGGCVKDPCCFSRTVDVKVTVQLLRSSSTNTQTDTSSNVNNAVSNFKGAKGAFLRVAFI